MHQGDDRGRRDVRTYGRITLVAGIAAVVTAILLRDSVTSTVLLVLALLLLPVLLLLRRDALRRDRLDGDGSDPRVLVDPAPADGAELTGAIVVTRPAGFHQDALRRYDVLVDGQRVGRLRRGESLRHPVPAGRHDVVARIDWSGSSTVPVDVPLGATVTLRVGPGSPLRGFFSSDGWLTLSVEH